MVGETDMLVLFSPIKRKTKNPFDYEPTLFATPPEYSRGNSKKLRFFVKTPREHLYTNAVYTLPAFDVFRTNIPEKPICQCCLDTS